MNDEYPSTTLQQIYLQYLKLNIFCENGEKPQKLVKGSP